MRALLRSDDARDVRLGLDLLAGEFSPAPLAELRRIAEDGDPELRLRALAGLAASGDERAADAAAQVGARPRALGRPRRPARRGGGADRRGPQAARRAARRPRPGRAARGARRGRPRGRDARGGRPARRRGGRGSADDRPRRRGGRAARRAAPSGCSPRRSRVDAAGRRLPLVRAAAIAAATHGAATVAPALEDPDRSVVLAALDALGRAGGRGAADPDAARARPRRRVGARAGLGRRPARARRRRTTARSRARSTTRPTWRGGS